MRLIEQFKKDGDFLFRWRSYLPLIIVPFMVLVAFSFGSPLFSDDKYNNALIIIALVVGIAGQIVRIWVAGFAPKDTSGRNTFGQQAALLNTSGIYSLCRNPLYLGNFLMMLSPVILVGNWIFMGLFALGFWLYYERIICAEEAFLSQKFGESYAKWCDLTPCFIPKFKHYQKSALSFSLKSTLRREYHSLFGLASSLLATKSNHHGNHASRAWRGANATAKLHFVRIFCNMSSDLCNLPNLSQKNRYFMCRKSIM